VTAGRTAKLTRPEPRWFEYVAGMLASSCGRYGLVQISRAWFAFLRDPKGGLVPIHDGAPLDSLEAAKARVEAHRFGHVGPYVEDTSDVDTEKT
jgi:hypothetical protein